MPPFNLPQPWSAGYTLPKYVNVENLQRRSFVTQQMPRGTYDDARVGDGGYAVPRYVMDEGTGQGVTITKWAPRGTAPRVDHFIQTPRTHLVSSNPTSRYGTNYVIASGAQPAPHPFKQYGANVANHVLGTIAKLPAKARKPALKSLLDRIDPLLYSRIEATASKAAKAGVPARRALHHAISTHFHGGIMRELAQVGTTGQVKPASQVGLGCYGCAAIGLGDTASDTSSWTATSAAWAAAHGGVPPHWERAMADGSTGPANACGYVWIGPPLPASAPGVASPAGSTAATKYGCPVPRVHLPGDTGPTQQGVPVTALPYCGTIDASGNPITPCNPTVPAGFGKTITIGPFTFPGDATDDSRNRWTNRAKGPPPAVLNYLKSLIATHIDAGKVPIVGDNNPFVYWFGLPISMSTDYYSDDEGKLPFNSIIASYRNPYNNRDYGLFLSIRGGGDPLLLARWAPLSEEPQGTWGAVTGGIGTVAGWVKDAAVAIANAACQAVNTPGSMQAAAAGATAGAPGAAAAAGVVVAKGLCGPGAQPTPLIAPMAPQSSLTTWLLIGGVGIAAVYFLTKD